MRTLTLALVVLVTVAFVGSALAVGPGKTVEMAGGSEGKVVFKGDTHKVNKCPECHPKLFQMKKGQFKMVKADHVPGKLCGTCHDGTKAFAQDAANCKKCHAAAAAGAGGYK